MSMAAENVVTPVMLNRPIVDPKTGALTQYGYAILSGLQLRTGGSVGSVVDVPALEDLIERASMFPVEQPRHASAVAGCPETMQPIGHQQTLLETYQAANCCDLGEMTIWHPAED